MVIQGGGNLVTHPPAFANDGKRLLVCTGTSVTVLSVATTLPVLHLSGHTDIVTSVVVVATPGVNHAWTSSLDGTIRLWDFVVGNLIRTVTVGRSIESMVIPSLSKPVPKPVTKAHGNIAFVSVQWEKETQPKTTGMSWKGRVILINLSTGKPLRGFLAKTLRPQRLFVSPHGGLVGMPDNRKIWVWSVPDGAFEYVNTIKGCLLHHTKTTRVMAFDPTETMVAGGDDTGRILCWYNVGERTFSVNSSQDEPSLAEDGEIRGGVRDNDDAEACTTYHWHANAVMSLSYSVDGTYLFSGAAEATLVIWQPETGKQQFLPRLGGQIYFITPSPDPSLFAISCSDNAIRFVNTGTMNVEKSWEGIKPVVPMPNLFQSMNITRAAFSPQGGKLALPTDNVAVQFYDVERDCEFFKVQVAPRTNISGSNADPRRGFAGSSTFVTHVTFSSDGSVMVTVNSRLPEGNIGGSACLKFWHFGSRNQKFVLNTMVDEPHGAEITALVYHPSEHMVVSCSMDATFKVWVAGAAIQEEETGKEVAWRCRSVGSYRHKEMFSAAFSPDGSLLGVAAGELVTLWNPYSNGFVTSLACVPSPQKVSVLAFVHHSKYLVAASTEVRPRLVVWHLPTLSVLWSCAVYVEALAVDPDSTHFGIIALAPPSEQAKSWSGDVSSWKATVALLRPDNPTPTAAWSMEKGVGGTLLFASSKVLSSKLQLKDEKHQREAHVSNLVVVTASREYVVLSPYSQEDDTQTICSVATPLIEAAPSAYFATYGKVPTPSNKESDKDVIGIRAAKPWGDLLNSSSHVLPSLTRLSLTFFESLLEKSSDIDIQLGREPESLTS